MRLRLTCNGKDGEVDAGMSPCREEAPAASRVCIACRRGHGKQTQMLNTIWNPYVTDKEIKQSEKLSCLRSQLLEVGFKPVRTPDLRPLFLHAAASPTGSDEVEKNKSQRYSYKV